MKKLTYAIPLIFWVTLIFIFSNQSFESQSIQPRLQERISEEDLRQIVPEVNIIYINSRFNSKEEPYRFVEFAFRKTAHVAVFAILAILAWLALNPLRIRERWKYVLSLVIVILVASLDEWNQAQMDSRTGAVEDVILDTAGGVIGLALVWLIRRWRKR